LAAIKKLTYRAFIIQNRGDKMLNDCWYLQGEAC
jgi:hypothetical protein